MANAVGYATVDSPIGPLLVAATERGLCFIQFGAGEPELLPVIVPCHRVIGANGHLVGYGGGLSVKQRLLAQEGVSSYAQQDLFAEPSR